MNVSLDELMELDIEQLMTVAKTADYMTAKAIAETADKAYRVYRMNYLNGTETAELRRKRKRVREIWNQFITRMAWLESQPWFGGERWTKTWEKR